MWASTLNTHVKPFFTNWIPRLVGGEFQDVICWLHVKINWMEINRDYISKKQHVNALMKKETRWFVLQLTMILYNKITPPISLDNFIKLSKGINYSLKQDQSHIIMTDICNKVDKLFEELWITLILGKWAWFISHKFLHMEIFFGWMGTSDRIKQI